MTVTINGSTGVSQIQDGTVTSTKIVDGSVAKSDLANPFTVALSGTMPSAGFELLDIPTWVKRISIHLESLSSTSAVTFHTRVGTANTPITTDYSSVRATITTGPGVQVTADTTSIASFPTSAAATTITGSIVLVKTTDNIWMASASGYRTVDNMLVSSQGSISLAAPLNYLAFALSTGTVDSGTYTVMYEG